MLPWWLCPIIFYLLRAQICLLFSVLLSLRHFLFSASLLDLLSSSCTQCSLYHFLSCSIIFMEVSFSRKHNSFVRRGGPTSDSYLCDQFLAYSMSIYWWAKAAPSWLSSQPPARWARLEGSVFIVLLSASWLFAFRFWGLFCCAELRWMLRSRCLKSMSMLSAAGSPSASAVSTMTSWHRPRKGGLRVGPGTLDWSRGQRCQSGYPIYFSFLPERRRH